MESVPTNPPSFLNATRITIPVMELIQTEIEARDGLECAVNKELPPASDDDRSDGTLCDDNEEDKALETDKI